MTTHPTIPTVRIPPPHRVNDRVTVPAPPEATVMDMPSAEAEYVLRTVEERGIRFVRLWFTDVLGFLKSFTITSQELEGAFADGMGFDGSSIEGFSRIQESDMIAVPDAPTFLDKGGYFDETPLDVATDYRKRTVVYLESMGIPVEYVHHEVAPSQHEIDLRYADALTMADSVMTYRLTVKEVAQEFGIHATFMPKPVGGVNGSGMHTHQSLFEGDRNAFFDATDEYHLSKLARSYI